MFTFPFQTISERQVLSLELKFYLMHLGMRDLFLGNKQHLKFALSSPV